eukprot:GHVU01224766.1.p1 GENE.GHVU01224766.1~~GHVU01224766.1.p1  ORF type:complete len:163 (+),score=27.71 GHVU01224766.1:27-515(+)
MNAGGSLRRPLQLQQQQQQQRKASRGRVSTGHNLCIHLECPGGARGGRGGEGEGQTQVATNEESSSAPQSLQQQQSGLCRRLRTRLHLLNPDGSTRNPEGGGGRNNLIRSHSTSLLNRGPGGGPPPGTARLAGDVGAAIQSGFVFSYDDVLATSTYVCMYVC